MKMKERWKWFCTDCTLLFLYFITFSNQGVSTHVLNPTLAQQNGACSIRDCKKNAKNDDMMINFNTKNLNDFFGAKITRTCGNKTTDVCEVWFSNSNDNRNKTCILTNATSDHGSVTVNNGAKYVSCKIQLEFYKDVHCVQGDSDHKEIVEAVDGGGVTTVQSPNASPTKASTTNASTTKSTGGAVKDSTNITPTPPADKTTSAAAKNTLCISPMLALIFWSLYF